MVTLAPKKCLNKKTLNEFIDDLDMVVHITSGLLNERGQFQARDFKLLINSNQFNYLTQKINRT